MRVLRCASQVIELIGLVRCSASDIVMIKGRRMTKGLWTITSLVGDNFNLPQPTANRTPIDPLSLHEHETMADFKAIHSLVRWDKPELKDALKSPAHANAVDPGNGNTCIHIAAQNGNLAVCQLLASKGADLSAQNNNGQTALHMAVAYGLLEVKDFLLSKGANKDVTNSDGFKAISGIEGDYGVPSRIGKASTAAELLTVFADAESLPAGTLDRAKVAGAGMQKKRGAKEIWDGDVAAKFAELIGKLG